MKSVKDYVQTKVRPEGSMAEEYVMEDTLGFCTEYMSRFTAIRRRVWDDKEEHGLFDEEFEGGGVKHVISDKMRNWAHKFVLDNAAHLDSYRR